MLLLLGGFLLACEPADPGPPTITRQPSLAPSATVLPFASPQPSEQAIGRSNPTEAALAAEGEPSQEAALSNLPTQASIPLVVVAQDGTLLGAAYYGAVVQTAPTLILVHGESGDQSRLIPLASTLQNSAYNVLLLFLRGYGDSGGSRDWSLAQSDIQAAFETLRSVGLSQQWSLVTDQNAIYPAMAACQTESNCQALIAFNPPASEDVSITPGTVPWLVFIEASAATPALPPRLVEQWANYNLAPPYNQWEETVASMLGWLEGVLLSNPG
jgi:pimeloyl-ACP methyl ester carboxylesterase